MSGNLNTKLDYLRRRKVHGKLLRYPLASFIFSFLYSAILYLNEDFQGGNLFFTEMDAVTLTVSLPQALDMGLGEKEGHLELNSWHLSLTN